MVLDLLGVINARNIMQMNSVSYKSCKNHLLITIDIPVIDHPIDVKMIYTNNPVISRQGLDVAVIKQNNNSFETVRFCRFILYLSDIVWMSYYCRVINLQLSSDII